MSLISREAETICFRTFLPLFRERSVMNRVKLSSQGTLHLGFCTGSKIKVIQTSMPGQQDLFLAKSNDLSIQQHVFNPKNVVLRSLRQLATDLWYRQY